VLYDGAKKKVTAAGGACSPAGGARAAPGAPAMRSPALPPAHAQQHSACGPRPQGFLTVKGTGYRKNRKGHPLPNIYRQWCDSRAMPCIVIEQAMTPGEEDVVVVDLTPLRLLDSSQVGVRHGGRRSGSTDHPRPPQPSPGQLATARRGGPRAAAAAAAARSSRALLPGAGGRGVPVRRAGAGRAGAGPGAAVPRGAALRHHTSAIPWAGGSASSWGDNAAPVAAGASLVQACTRW
jgi:hypothetical protein